MLETWLTAYGYPVVLVGTFLEGETMLVLSGVAAHLGYLSLQWVIIWGFVGTITSDQLYFFLGRRYGKTLLARRPAWQPATERILRRLKRHQNLLILSFRFLYGLRTVTPFAIGISDISWLRYTLLNAISAAIWATAVGLAGYSVGHAVAAVIDDIQRYQLEVIGTLMAVAALLWLLHLRHRRRHSGNGTT